MTLQRKRKEGVLSKPLMKEFALSTASVYRDLQEAVSRGSDKHAEPRMSLFGGVANIPILLASPCRIPYSPREQTARDGWRHQTEEKADRKKEEDHGYRNPSQL